MLGYNETVSTIRTPVTGCPESTFQRVAQTNGGGAGSYELLRIEVQSPSGQFTFVPGQDAPLQWSHGVSDAVIVDRIVFALGRRWTACYADGAPYYDPEEVFSSRQKLDDDLDRCAGLAVPEDGDQRVRVGTIECDWPDSHLDWSTFTEVETFDLMTFGE